MEWTGERMIPAAGDKLTFWEHVARYRFAIQFVQGKKVLDIACGEGYGSAAMQRGGAAAVIGVDISKEACDHARHQYGIDARVGSAQDIPLETHSVDAIVSFETIEHVNQPEAFLRECQRVLVPGGVIVLSTPNKEEYQKYASDNPFHCSELGYDEFQKLFESYFTSVEYYGQHLPQPWFWGTRGFGRVARYVQHQIIPEVAQPLSDQDRLAVQDHILKPLRPLESKLNPWIVQKGSQAQLKQCRYLVAVGRQPGTDQLAGTSSGR